MKHLVKIRDAFILSFLGNGYEIYSLSHVNVRITFTQ